MLCIECGAKAEKGFMTDVTDFGTCLITIRNVPLNAEIKEIMVRE
jgi:YgiT-type zinc finger domain-containing protein